MKYRLGMKCPKCQKGKLEKAKECKNSKHKNEFICKTCYFSNF